MSHPVSQHCKCLAAVVALAAFLTVAAARADDAVNVDGDVSKPRAWTVAQAKDRFTRDIHHVQYESRGQAHTADCIPLLSLTQAAGVDTEMKMDPKADPKVKNFPLRLAVLVQGRDGYTAVFSLAELLASGGDHPAWLAFNMDGKPLSDADGPFKLIVPDDKKPGRWVRSVTTIRVVDVAAKPAVPATQPAGKSTLNQWMNRISPKSGTALIDVIFIG